MYELQEYVSFLTLLEIANLIQNNWQGIKKHEQAKQKLLLEMQEFFYDKEEKTKPSKKLALYFYGHIVSGFTPHAKIFATLVCLDKLTENLPAFEKFCIATQMVYKDYEKIAPTYRPLWHFVFLLYMARLYNKGQLHRLLGSKKTEKMNISEVLLKDAMGKVVQYLRFYENS